MRKQDKAFDQACNEAIESAVDDLEQAAWDRAISGEEEYVVSQGRVVVFDGKPLKVRKKSDTLHARLLEAHRPEKYRHRQTITHEGAIDTTCAKDKLKGAVDKFASGT